MANYKKMYLAGGIHYRAHNAFDKRMAKQAGR